MNKSRYIKRAQRAATWITQVQKLYERFISSQQRKARKERERCQIRKDFIVEQLKTHDKVIDALENFTN